VHLDSGSLDWDRLENACKLILACHGFSYYLEQALLAVLMAQQHAEPLDPTDYVVHPTPDQAERGEGVAQHFVDRSSLLLHLHGWQHALGQAATL
jgi:hypothetical protein